ncbi:MAG: hypothetical protein QG669_176 [Patescibacteria group bacterium]|jgi:membrane-bound inhibitor of C-type lysozyme|nr:hypothetical protein [Patescibacteria group bacterium]MDQ5961784.1 hypothetical protein [Patescibacteria group bacterium]
MEIKFKREKVMNYSSHAKHSNAQLVINVRKFLFFSKKYSVTPGREELHDDHIEIKCGSKKITILYKNIESIKMVKIKQKPRTHV